MTAVLDSIRQLDGLLSTLAADDVHLLPDAELLDQVIALHAAADRVHAQALRRLALADTRGASGTQHGIGTRSWLRSSTRMSEAAASGTVRLARALSDELPTTNEGLAAGAVTLEQARVIHRHVRDLPLDRRADVEAHLAEQAARFGADDLRVLARRVREVVAPELSERSFRERYESRWLSWNTTLDGMLHLEGMLDPLAGQLVRNALDPLTLPLGPHDERTADQRRADALVELCTVQAARTRADTEADPPDAVDAPGDGGTETASSAARPLARRSTAQLLLMVDVETLAQRRRRPTHPGDPPQARSRPDQLDRPGVPGPELSGIGPVPWSVLDQLACDGDLRRLLMRGQSEILDLGRRVRLATPAQRLALTVRDGGCAFPLCARPAEWSDVHHLTPFSAGGHTNVAEMVLLCRTHHTQVHRGTWSVAADVIHGERTAVFRISRTGHTVGHHRLGPAQTTEASTDQSS